MSEDLMKETLKQFEHCIKSNDINAMVQPCLILGREHLTKQCEKKVFNEIEYSDFEGNLRKFQINPIIIFIDNDQNLSTKILKNRFGNNGTVGGEYSDEDVQKIAKVAYQDGFDSATQALIKTNELVQNKFQ
jgi:hypothetical protein